jgi:dihydroorotate dehydrogenase (fumarate)
LLRHGPAHVATLTDQLNAWLERKGYDSVAQARGVLAVAADVDASAYERAGYVRALRAAQASYGTVAY